MSLNLLNELLQNKEIRKQVLIEFGFGSANLKKVLKFIQEKFPTEYAELSSKETTNNPKVAQLMPKEIELSSRAERDAILDNKVKGESENGAANKRNFTNYRWEK